FLNKYPEYKILKTLNNAKLIQFKLYLSGFNILTTLWEQCNNELFCLIKKLKENKERITKQFD
ncbi:MAG: hypothetical protein D6780_01355, partial [Candidatus Dadabacteria bacterium]